MVLDLDADGLYDEAEETCFDQVDAVGFTVEEAVTTAELMLGTDNPGDHEWTIGESEANNVMMQFTVAVNDLENIDVTMFSLMASGSGDDLTGLSNVMLV